MTFEALSHLDSLGKSGLRVAVIGATGAIGGALVTRLSEMPEVETIYALQRRDKTWNTSKVTALFMDLLVEDSIRDAAQQIEPPLHLVIVASGVLHNDAGLKPEKCIKDFNGDDFAQVFAINTTGPALVAKYFLPKLARHQKAVFAALSARVGSINDNALGGWYAYRASKAALNMIIRNLSIETRRMDPQAIVMALHPGTVDSPLSAPYQQRVPEGKLFTPDKAAASLLERINNATENDSGHIIAWDGEVLPY